MKKLLRALLCTGLLAGMLSVPAFAAGSDGMLISPAPAQGDFGVLVNGEYVAFTDAVPKIKNDRSCLPFVAVFEQLGFAEKDMTWNSETKTVTATKGGTTIGLTIGKNEIALTQDGKTEVIATDVAPYIEPSLSRTYIPFGLVADALGYNVGWDADDRVVIIDDVDAILAANEETYKLMDKYLAYSKSFSEKNQKVTGDYAVDMGMTSAIEGQTLDMGFDADGTYEMLISGSDAFQFDTDMTMDMTVAQNGVDITDAMATEGAPQLPMTIDMAMRGSLSDGVFYYQSAALAEMMEQPDLANAWFKLDMKALFDQMGAELGMDYAALMDMSLGMMDMSFEDILAASLKIAPLTDADATTADALAAVNAMVGDSAFKKSGSTYVSTLDADGVKMSFTLYTSGSKVNGYAMELIAADPTFGEITLAASMKDSKMNMEMGIAMAMAEGADSTSVTMSMTMDGLYKATSAKPATEPPANSVVIDMMALMAQAAPQA